MERRGGRSGAGKGGEERRGEGRGKPTEQPQLRTAPIAARCRVARQLERAHSSPALLSAAGERDARREKGFSPFRKENL